MPPIQPCALPAGALLARYARAGAYTDCYTTEIGRAVTLAEYVEAFYTTAVFKLERRLLAWFASKPSTDAQARQLAASELSTFSAWRVEERGVNQLLMCDLTGNTRSWLMVAPGRLYFGSAVLSRRFPFGVLLGFHKVYSRVLLRSARDVLSEAPRV